MDAGTLVPAGESAARASIVARGRITLDDLEAGTALHRAQTRRLNGVLWAVIFLLSTLAALFIESLAIDMRDSIALLVGAILVSIAGVLAAALVARSQRRRILGDLARLYGDCEVVFTPDGFESKTGVADFRFLWKDMISWKEDDRTVLMYGTKDMYSCLPKRWLSSDDLDQVRGYAFAAGVKGAVR